MITPLLILGLLAGALVAVGQVLLSTKPIAATTYAGLLPRWVAWSLWPAAIVAWVVYGASLAGGSKTGIGRDWAYGLTAAALGAWAGGAGAASALIALGVTPAAGAVVVEEGKP